MLANMQEFKYASHWWTEWAPAWGYIPATGAGEEDTLPWGPNIPRIICLVHYPFCIIGKMILHKWSLVYWGLMEILGSWFLVTFKTNTDFLPPVFAPLGREITFPFRLYCVSYTPCVLYSDLVFYSVCVWFIQNVIVGHCNLNFQDLLFWTSDIWDNRLSTPIYM